MDPHEIALTQLEAESDLWAEQVDLRATIDHIVHVSRLAQSVQADVREGMISRQKTLLNALMRQAFIEGAFRAVEAIRDHRDAQGGE